MWNFQGIALIWTQAYREVFKSVLVSLQELYEHVLLYLVLLQILMVSKKEGGENTEVSRQISLRNSKILSMLPNSDLNWCWLVIQFAINLDFSESAVTWKRKLKNIFFRITSEMKKVSKFNCVSTIRCCHILIYFEKNKKIKQTSQ